jgi:hypothetical protein
LARVHRSGKASHPASHRARLEGSGSSDHRRQDGQVERRDH